MRSFLTAVIAMFTAFSIQIAHAASLSTENMQRARLQLDSSYKLDSLGKCYLRSLEPETYERFKDNEFEFERVVKEAVKDLKKWVNSYDVNELVLLRTRVSFGSYDTEAAGFQFSPFNINSQFQSKGGRSLKCLGRQTLSFVNPDLLSVLPMPKGRAQSFLQSRPKTHRGEYSRDVYLDLKIKLIRYDAPSIQGAIVEAVVRDINSNSVIHVFEENRETNDLIPQG